MSERKFASFEELYDFVRKEDDDFISEDEFLEKIETLVSLGLIEKLYSPLDVIAYVAKNNLKWADIVNIQDSLQKDILLVLIENPKTFFVLLNTQKGKLKIAANEIKDWGNDKSVKVISFLIVDNDKTLSDQSVDGVQRVFENQPVKIFQLSSNTKTTEQDIKTYINAYVNDIDNEYHMPLITLLANPKQYEKMINLLYYIHKKIVNHKSLLRYGVVWDEADKTYPNLRTKKISIDDQQISYLDMITIHDIGLYRQGFVTATEGDLLDQDYPECANAYLYPIILDEKDKLNYRAIHHPDSIIKTKPYTTKHSNNSYATEIITDNISYFTTPIILSSGETYYRKTIINSNAKTQDMKEFAKFCNTKNMYAMVFNGYGGPSVKLFIPNQPMTSHKTKGQKFNEILFYLYKMRNLHDKPLIIIGRRKVDRGLGFHYPPKEMKIISGEYGYYTPTPSKREGLIWTDFILSKIENKASAVQKAGRGAGIIADCPQYCGSVTYWTDAKTAELVCQHNKIVDITNDLSGLSASQAYKHATEITPSVKKNQKAYDDIHYAFIPWEINPDGTKQEYGKKEDPKSIAYKIHELRKIYFGNDGNGFRAIILSDDLEPENPEKQTHYKTLEGKYMSMYKKMDDGKHLSEEYENIKNTGKAVDNKTARQTLCYKDNTLGVGLRLPNKNKIPRDNNQEDGDTLHL